MSMLTASTAQASPSAPVPVMADNCGLRAGRHTDVLDYDKLYIDGAVGRLRPARGTIDVINATTEEVMGRIPEGTADDVDRAVAAAKAAFATWSQTARQERGKYLQRLAEASAPATRRSPRRSAARSACRCSCRS